MQTCDPHALQDRTQGRQYCRPSACGPDDECNGMQVTDHTLLLGQMQEDAVHRMDHAPGQRRDEHGRGRRKEILCSQALPRGQLAS